MKDWNILSPDGSIDLHIIGDDEGKIQFEVKKGGFSLLGLSSLGINTDIADFTGGLEFVGIKKCTIYEPYELIGTKRKHCLNYCNEITLKFIKNERTIHIIFRAYDDGIAYRFYIPGNGGISIYNETGSFKLFDDTMGWAQNFIPSYEAFYDKRTYEDLLSGNFGMPVLINRGTVWGLITEAGVYGNYLGVHLTGDKDEECLKIAYPPDQINCAVSTKPFYTPWRTVILGNLSQIVESTLVESLNPDCEVADTSWIKPGRSAWSWWSGDSTQDYATQVKYVDFAARMGWEYYLCDAGWKDEWIGKLVSYAQDKNIKILVWFHYKDLGTDDLIESKLSSLTKVGVKGIKVDFFESDSQDRIKLYDKLAKAAAKYNLLLVYHGATKPSGERRRWPHIMTREGILGAEYYKWSDGPTAEHNTTIPFTRNVVGPMDYTPVTFSNNRNQTTWAHQLSLAVIFESSIQHFADKPESYEQIGDAIDFLKKCPTTWDDTKFIDGYPGKYIVLARRSGSDWFIGAICGANTQKSLYIDLSFVDDLKYAMDSYKDGDRIDSIICEKSSVFKNDRIKINLAVNGGFAAHLYPEAALNN